MARRKVLLYAHDGMGLGHLRRISRLAAALKDEFSTLILSGMREAAWIVPNGCGLVKLPDWDGLTLDRAERAGTKPWIDLDAQTAATFRGRAILDIAQLYQPDALIVDYLPFGQRRELEALLASLPCRRYFLHRGISDSSDAATLRGGPATEVIAAHYDRILVASDLRLGNLADDDAYSDAARAILTYVGFIAPGHVPAESVTPFVACSSGGGHQAEPLMRACVAVAKRQPDIPFRIVLGPRSRLRIADLDAPANCEVWQQREDLPALHAAAAVVISTGGYNSMLEAAFGGAMLIVHPKHVGDDDEQRRFADRLSLHHPVRRIGDLATLEAELLACWHERRSRCREPLMLRRDGGEHIQAIISRDLGQTLPAGQTRHGSEVTLRDTSAAGDRPIVSLEDFRLAAQRLLPADLFDYIDGGACDEVTLRANRNDFEAIRLAPLVFRDVGAVDTVWSSSLGRHALPIGVSPTALHRLVHERGEIATASAARAVGVPMIVSMMASHTIEAIAEGSAHGGLWLQVYLLKDRGITASLVERAEQAGFKAVVVSAGCPVIGKRDRNIANGFSLPADIVAANFPRNDRVIHNNPIHSFDGAALDPAATWDDLAWLAGRTRLPVLVKGLLNRADVAPALSSGAAGLIVSNHGGRQLDGTMSTISALPEVVEAVAGYVPILIDGGVRRGTDALKAIALGADAVLLGSPILWALATQGEQGVVTALTLLGDELSDALRLAGFQNLSCLRDHAAAILRRRG